MKVVLNSREQFGSQRGKGNLSRRAVEKPDAQLVLQLLDQHAQPRRGDEQRASGACEAAMLRGQQKGPELARRKIDH
jgi:hypothetical protein